MENAAALPQSISTKDRIIVALDVHEAAAAREIVKELAGEAGAFKIGLQLFTAAGPKLVRELAESGVRIFLDLKFHDIPNTVAKAAIEAARLGAWMFNVHTLGGSEMMRRTIAEAGEACERENIARPKIIGVTILTSTDANGLAEIGIERSVRDEVVSLAGLAQASGMDGVVASAEEAGPIRDAAGKEFMIVTPGIRPAFATNDDQKRVMTPREALSAGSDYLVIGRPVTGSSDRTKAVRQICEEIRTASKLSE